MSPDLHEAVAKVLDKHLAEALDPPAAHTIIPPIKADLHDLIEQQTSAQLTFGRSFAQFLAHALNTEVEKRRRLAIPWSAQEASYLQTVASVCEATWPVWWATQLETPFRSAVREYEKQMRPLGGPSLDNPDKKYIL